MNMAKWLLLAVLALPAMELAAFIAVALAIGFLPALALVVTTSLVGALILRHAGGNHIARMRMVLGQGSFTALQADDVGGITLLAGFLLLFPGFVTDSLGLLLLVAPLRRLLSVGLRGGASPQPEDGVVDLSPEQWHHVPDPELSDRCDNRREQP